MWDSLFVKKKKKLTKEKRKKKDIDKNVGKFVLWNRKNKDLKT